ncbi:MAG: PASTA domain-containing protein [Actinomycetota bacterium]|nr:PASTA domain-containing protein [Actinomycetota bacterium]
MSPRGPGWAGTALAAALAALAGVLITVALGGGHSDTVRTVTVVTHPPPEATLIAKTAVPNVVGERLDVAKDRVRRASFIASVEGGGILGVLRDRNWQVRSQDPVGGQVLQTGSTVRLRVERR